MAVLSVFVFAKRSGNKIVQQTVNETLVYFCQIELVCNGSKLTAFGSELLGPNRVGVGSWVGIVSEFLNNSFQSYQGISYTCTFDEKTIIGKDVDNYFEKLVDYWSNYEWLEDGNNTKIKNKASYV